MFSFAFEGAAFAFDFAFPESNSAFMSTSCNFKDGAASSLLFALAAAVAPRFMLSQNLGGSVTGCQTALFEIVT